MKRRWLLYILTGAAFGVFDFYYHAFISNALLSQQQSGPGGRLAWIFLSVGIWLAPVIPIVLHEAKASRSARLSALAASLTWCVAVIAYYLNNAVQLAFIGVPSRPEMHFSNASAPYFWENWKSVLIYTLLLENIIWVVVALVGGAAIGFFVSALYLRRTLGSPHPTT